MNRRALLLAALLFPPGIALRADDTAPLPDLKGLRVALDVGHSVKNPGAGSARGVGEFYFNQATARALRLVLMSAGADVFLINEDGDVQDLLLRTDMAFRGKADVFISVHHDSCHPKYKKKWEFEGKTQEYCDNFKGYGVFVSQKHPQAEKSRSFGLLLGRAMHDAGFRPTLHHNEPIEGENRPLIDRETGVYEYSDLIVVKRTAMPAALLECGVIVHRDEELEVQKPEYRRRLCVAVTRSLGAAVAQGVIVPGSGRDLKPSQPAVVPPGTGGGAAPTPTPPTAAPPEEKKGLLRRVFDRDKKTAP